MSVLNGYMNDAHSEFPDMSGCAEALEDVEHPAWISSTSFSESCSSLSLISNVKENDSPVSAEVRMVPDEIADLAEGPSKFNEDDAPYIMSGSLQSLSSSSKTVYASTRSNSENQLYISLNKSLRTEKANGRCKSLFRERVSSENPLDFSNLSNIRDSKLSHSLHDVSIIPSNGLRDPSRRPQTTRSSLSALHLRNRSRDSGFTHSGSLLSLSSGCRNYDHVESKVKRYIQNIKDADAERKRERMKRRSLFVSDSPKASYNYDFSKPEDSPELLYLVQSLQQDLENKDRILLKLQEDYNCLLGKYAQAENRIDRMRFSWCKSGHPSMEGNSPPGLKNKSHIISAPRRLEENLAEIDDSSLTSTINLSYIENSECQDTSFPRICDEHRSRKCKGKDKNLVVVSAPLRPVSRLYCTSARLDRVVTPLSSKSSVDALSVSSCHESCGVSSSMKIKKASLGVVLPAVTVRDATIDTGIDSCCPQSTASGTCFPHKAEPIGHLPHEDSILKVQRWQKSLPTSTKSGAKFSPCSKSALINGNKIPERSYNRIQMQPEPKLLQNTCDAKIFSSIGIQVNGVDESEFPSISSELNTPVVPCLNLGELSGCSEEFSGMLSCENCKRKHSSKHTTRSMSNSNLNPISATDCDSSLPSKSFTSNIELPSSSRHLCKGKSGKCACSMKLDRKDTSSSQSLKDKRSNLNGSDHAKSPSLMWRDQDHVVPASPEEERSFQNAFKIIELKMNTLKRSVNLQYFIRLLDVILEKVSSKDCSCCEECCVPSDSGGNEKLPSNPVHLSSVPLQCSETDSSLLQCLEEVDDYTHQVWAKTESFLEVLNASKCEKSHKLN